MEGTGRFLVVIGTVLVIIGLLVTFRDSIPFFRHLGKLPGDIVVRGERFSFYFPVATSVVVSLVVSLVLYLLNRAR